MDLRADVEALVKVALHELKYAHVALPMALTILSKEKEREWIEREKALRAELSATYETQLCPTAFLRLLTGIAPP